MKILIKNGHVVDAKTGIDCVADVFIESGKILGIRLYKQLYRQPENGQPENERLNNFLPDVTIDATGMHVLPGLVDAHCHLREPGQEYKEDIASGTLAAAKGGFTSIACMPNTEPVIDKASLVEYVKEKARKSGVVNVYPIATVSQGRKGELMSEMEALKCAGAVAFSDDGASVASSSLMKKALLYSSMFCLPIISHCEDNDLVDGGVMNESYTSTITGLKGIPSAAEEVMVARDIILSEYTGVPVHLAHISTALSVQLIREGKKRGVKVTAETCPHYFSLTDEACKEFDTNAKVNPPLRGEKDIDAIINGLIDGTIDIIATDHAPHHIDDKQVEFSSAASGISGFETAFGVSYTYLVKSGIMNMTELVNKLCLSPARLLKLDKGTIEEGRDADIIIVDTTKKFTVEPEKFLSKGKNTPFRGFELFGTVEHTIVGGRLVIKEGQPL